MAKKRWDFIATYLVSRACTIEAETEEEAREKWEAGEFEEGHDIDAHLEDYSEPNWDNFEEDSE